jgi:hypothetical protein
MAAGWVVRGGEVVVDCGWMVYRPTPVSYRPFATRAFKTRNRGSPDHCSASTKKRSERVCCPCGVVKVIQRQSTAHQAQAMQSTRRIARKLVSDVRGERAGCVAGEPSRSSALRMFGQHRLTLGTLYRACPSRLASSQHTTHRSQTTRTATISADVAANGLEPGVAPKTLTQEQLAAEEEELEWKRNLSQVREWRRNQSQIRAWVLGLAGDAIFI